MSFALFLLCLFLSLSLSHLVQPCKSTSGGFRAPRPLFHSLAVSHSCHTTVFYPTQGLTHGLEARACPGCHHHGCRGEARIRGFHERLRWHQHGCATAAWLEPAQSICCVCGALAAAAAAGPARSSKFIQWAAISWSQPRVRRPITVLVLARYLQGRHG